MSRHKKFNEMDVPPKISLETSALCNRKCEWCPQHDHPRKQELMPIETVKKVVKELAEIGFDGSVGLHLFNEPLMDKRIVEIVRIVRSALPKSEIYFHSNGDVVTAEKMRELFAAGLDRCTFNQYDRQAKEKFSVFLASLTDEERKRVRYRTFHKHHIYNRAGLVKTSRKVPLERQCRRIRQMCINYKGDAVLCCNDFLGQVCVGNVNKKSVLDLYNDTTLKVYRAQLKDGHRAGLNLCNECDLFG